MRLPKIAPPSSWSPSKWSPSSWLPSTSRALRLTVAGLAIVGVAAGLGVTVSGGESVHNPLAGDRWARSSAVCPGSAEPSDFLHQFVPQGGLVHRDNVP